MPQPSYNVHATSITSYALAWGFLCELGRKGILTPQEVIDVLDFGLAFVEEQSPKFDDQRATDTARQLLESLMRVVRDHGIPKSPSSRKNP